MAKKASTPPVRKTYVCTVIMTDDNKHTFDQEAFSLKDARDACLRDTRVKTILTVVSK